MRIEAIHNIDCEVLIIGAGPAGSGLAIHLARMGIDVMLVDAQKFPRDKVCGDALSPLAIKELQILGVADRAEFSNANEIKVATIFVDDEDVGEIDLPQAKNVDAFSKVIPRQTLDNLIFEEAKSNGARCLEEHKLVDYKITADFVDTTLQNNGQTKVIRSKMIVGADGANSVVARIFHGSKPSQSERLFALRAYFEGINGPSDQGQIYFNQSNFPGLYWVFPTSETTANIGLGMIAETLPKNDSKIKDLLTNHIEQSPNLKKRIGNGEIVGKIHGWPLSNFNPEKKIVGDKVLLLGDAAGFINALSGDGVQYALQTANWASNTIHTCVEQNDYGEPALRPFANTVHKKLGLDFAFADIIVQAGRNKAFEQIALKLIKVLLQRSRQDRHYGSIIGGIFGGTYPSYSVLSPSFIAKTLIQLGTQTGKGLGSMISNDGQSDNVLETAAATLEEMTNTLNTINQDIPAHVDWARTLVKKGVFAGKNVVQNNR